MCFLPRWFVRSAPLLFGLLPAAAVAAVPPATAPYTLAQQSAIVLERANPAPMQAMPLGNGSLGAAVWSADGMTVQLNRADTWPDRRSPGQLVLPGLARLATAPDYHGRLDLATGEFVESGAGMRAVAYIETGTDALVVSVTGADPNAPQTAELRLWQPRQPRILLHDSVGVLAETWQDRGDAGAGGGTFGSLAAATAVGRDLRVEKSGAESVVLHFRPRANGSFRVVVAAPAWRGEDADGVAIQSVEHALLEPPSAHRVQWKRFWDQAAPLAMHSANGEAEYLAELREIYLYTAAAEVGSNFPGSHAGLGDMFSPLRDAHHWDPSAYWHWNLRMMVAANLSAGVPQLNRSYFALYRENLPSILNWTKQHMGGREGACVPETMRFNGKGYENEVWAKHAAINCGADSPPFYNARTLSTGSEVALWIWRQYQATDDRAFLAANYPVMAAEARFLLAYSTRDAQGTLHTYPANAHENRWDVHDPTTDIAAMRTVFPDIAAAAGVLHRDPALAAALRQAAAHQPALPEVSAGDRKTLLKAPGAGDALIAESYDPDAPIHNVENVGLEPVWPYEMTGPEPGDALHAVAVRTFTDRLNRDQADWSYDPLQAAHLGLADAVRTNLLALTEKYQAFPNGLAAFIGNGFFVEQTGVLTAALDDALAQQDAAGVVLVAPAWPAQWDADGTVALRHGLRVRVQMRAGTVASVTLLPGSEHTVTLRNPWPGKPVRAVAATGASSTLGAGSRLTVRLDHPVTLTAADAAPAAPLPLPPSPAPRRLGSRTIGLYAAAPLPAAVTGK